MKLSCVARSPSDNLPLSPTPSHTHTHRRTHRRSAIFAWNYYDNRSCASSNISDPTRASNSPRKRAIKLLLITHTQRETAKGSKVRQYESRFTVTVQTVWVCQATCMRCIKIFVKVIEVQLGLNSNVEKENVEGFYCGFILYKCIKNNILYMYLWHHCVSTNAPTALGMHSKLKINN